MSAIPDSFISYSNEDFLKLKKILHKNLFVKVKILTGSMRPLIKIDEVITVLPIKDDHEFIPFQVYLFRDQDKRLVCHFFWDRSKIDESNLLFRPLNSKWIDLPIKREEVFGMVKGKKVTWWLQIMYVLRAKFIGFK